MHGRPLARWELVAALTVTLGACQLPARERRMSEPTAPGRPAAGADVAPPATMAGSVDGAANVAPVDEGGEAAPAVAVPEAARDAGGEPAEGGGSHCNEPPERTAARESMRWMANEYAQMSARLRALRAEFEAQAKGLADDLSLERIPAIAADLAARSAEVPGAPAADAGFLASLLHEIAFWAVLCRALRDGLAECDRLDALEPPDGDCCRSVVRLVWLAHERPRELSLRSTLARMFGGNWQQLRDERIWQVVLRGRSETVCEGLVAEDADGNWRGPLCRALAARDVSRCAVLTGDSRPRICVALVHAILGPGTAAGDQPSAAGALLRELVAPSGYNSPCAEVMPRIVTEVFDAAGAFKPGPFVLPDIERERGLAPEP
jgi:hypothetical protein